MLNMTEKIFSYGTLCDEAVQLATFGRKLNGKNDAVSQFELSTVTITDPDVIAKSGKTEHPILIYTGDINDTVSGMVFDVSKIELEQADSYEVSDYKRINVKLASGLDAWMYVQSN